MRLIAVVLAALTSLSGLAQPGNWIYNPVERGQHAGQKRIGLWEYSDSPGKVSLIIDYDKGTLEYFEPDTSLYVIRSGSDWVKERLARPCRFHGSLAQLREYYQSQLDLSWAAARKIYRKDQPSAALLTFEVGEEGIARNPAIHGVDKSGFGKALLDAFNSAPNIWITGVKNDGTPCVCRFGISWEACLDSCKDLQPTPSKILLRRVNRVSEPPLTWRGGRAPAPARDNGIYFIEGLGMQFSPDDKMILLETSDISPGVTIRQAFIVPSDSGTVEIIPFSNVHGSCWMDNNLVFLKYSYGSAGMFMAEYNRSTGIVNTKRDSIAHLNLPSPDQTKLAFITFGVTAGRLTTRVWVYDRSSKISSLLRTDPLKRTAVVGWSPDQMQVLLDVKDHEIGKHLIYDLKTGETQQVPVLNATFCGWSKEGVIYFRRTGHADYGLQTQLFEFNSRSHVTRELSGKVKGLTVAAYSDAAKQFLFVIKDDLYVQNPSAEFRPLKLKENAVKATWSRDGKRIAFVRGKSRQIFVYDMVLNKSRQVADIP